MHLYYILFTIKQELQLPSSYIIFIVAVCKVQQHHVYCIELVDMKNILYYKANTILLKPTATEIA